MSFNTFSFFFRTINCVIDCEHVFRIYGIFYLLLPIDWNTWNRSFNKFFSKFTHSMMMTNWATCQENFITGTILNLFIQLNDVLLARASVINWEVYINCSTCIINLRNSERSPNFVLSKSSFCSFVVDSLFNSCTKLTNICPRYWSFKTLSSHHMLTAQISCISY